MINIFDEAEAAANLEIRGRDDGHSLEVSVDLRQGADEPRFLDFHFLEDVLDDLADVANRLCDAGLAGVDSLVVELVQLEEQLALSGHHFFCHTFGSQTPPAHPTPSEILIPRI